MALTGIVASVHQVHVKDHLVQDLWNATRDLPPTATQFTAAEFIKTMQGNQLLQKWI
jgi:hypothetical protein